MTVQECESVHSWIDEHLDGSISELGDFLRIESVSTQTHHAADVVRAAEWLRDVFEQTGLRAELHITAGHPIVVAEWRGALQGAPTVLVYGHYDVQPADPLGEWVSPPFEATIRDGRLYARGAADDKGQLWTHVMAIRAHIASRGTLPVNLMFVVEGEEECGSSNVRAFIEAHQAALRCDYVVVSDTVMFAEGIPSVLSSLRGMAYFEIECRGPARDLHSGQYGGAVANPASALARVIASLHDEDGAVAIDGFYDNVRTASIAERERIRALPFDENALKSEAGVPQLAGEKGFSVLERLWARPTCEVNGITSGYTGEGAKTVLPGSATAKVSFRLVQLQSPDEVHRLLLAHVSRIVSEGTTTTVRMLHGGRPWHADVPGPGFEAAQRALTKAFGREAVVVGAGGSIPIVTDLSDTLGAPVLLIGFGLPGENAHAPNEWLSIDNLRMGTHAIANLFDELAKSKGACNAE